MSRRNGITLIEVIVVVSIIGVLIALILPAISAIRESASRTESVNRLRSLALATHSFSSANLGRLPSSVGKEWHLHFVVLPYLDASLDFRYFADAIERTGSFPPVHVYYNPADPSNSTRDGQRLRGHLASYATNAQVFTGVPRLDRSFPDGTSNTIAFAEHYAVCRSRLFDYLSNNPSSSAGVRRPTFADKAAGDYYPDPKREYPAKTFQVAPRLDKCDRRLAQTPHPAGMLVALADGSCKTLSPGISPRTYWSAVTPAGGEILSTDW